jgi:uncharacterized protein YbjT (DUF2867 family)
MILVTGGTGFVGQEVVGKLLEQGYRVRLLVRRPDRAGRFGNHPRVELARGDALDPGTLPAAMTDVQAVIHLVGIIAENSRVTFEQVHVEATRNLLAAARKAGVTRWIQMSALGTRPRARSRYHLTKWEAEESVRQSGLDWTIFRPSLIYGYDERDRLLNLLRTALSWPLDVVQLHSFPLLNGGEPLVQPVSIREVAYCFARSPANEASIGRTYDLVGPVSFSWREMVLKILAVLGKKGVYQEVPLLLVVRKLLWLTALLLPCLLVADWWMSLFDPVWAEAGVGLEAILLFIAYRWREVILFGVPGEPLIIAGDAWNTVSPRPLQFSEQIKMAIEDNVGDPRPAMETFGYTPESFEQGLEKIFRKNSHGGR